MEHLTKHRTEDCICCSYALFETIKPLQKHIRELEKQLRLANIDAANNELEANELRDELQQLEQKVKELSR